MWGHCYNWLFLLPLTHDVLFPCTFCDLHLWIHVHWDLVCENSLEYGLNVDSSGDVCSYLPGMLKLKSSACAYAGHPNTVNSGPKSML